MVPVFNKHCTVYLRTLIDPCSTDNFISEKAAQRLQLTKNSSNAMVSGRGDITTSIAKGETDFFIGSIHNKDFKCHVNALILPKLTDMKPQHTYVQTEQWTHIVGLQLADPNHDKAGKIDLLLGVETYAEFVLQGLKKGPKGTKGWPIAQNTELGWILLGSTQKREQPSSSQCFLTHIDAIELSNQL